MSVDRHIVAAMRSSRMPMDVRELARLATAMQREPVMESDVAEALPELCASGPVVAVNWMDRCMYALEWGVLAPWETAP